MSEADHWDDISIADLGEIVAGGTPSRSAPWFWNGSIPWVTPGEIKALNSRYVRDTREKITSEGLAASAAKLLPVGSLLVTTRATLGEVAIAAVPVATNQGFKSIIPNERTDSLFAYYLLQTLRPEMKRLSSGTTFLEISKSDFARIRTRRPEPEEQSRIAIVLDLVDQAIAKTEAVIAKLKQMRAGLVNDLLTRGLDENGELRDPLAHPEEFEGSRLGQIPTAWAVRPLTELASFQNGKTFPSTQYCDTGVRLLRPGNLPSSEFVTWEPKDTICLPEKWVAFAPDYVVRGSELIMNLTAQSLEEQFLGRVCMTQAGDFCLLNQRLARFRPLDCDLRFLFWSLRGPVFRRQIDKNPQGTKVQHIYDRDLRAVHLPVPKDPAEQTKIVNILFGFANHIGAEQCLAQKLDSIRLGLRADLVTGRVRVPESIFASGSLA